MDPQRHQESRELVAQAERYGAHNYRPLEVVLSRGQGAFVWDVEGRRYVDMLSAYSAVGQGHCHPRIVEALVEQARRLALPSRAFHNDRMGDMLERIARLTGADQVLPMNSGAEAVETAIKAMRRWGYERRGIPDGAAEIVVFEGNFHGRTTTLVGFSDEPEYARHFGPPTPGFVRVPFDDLEAVEAAVGPATAGVLVEPIQGEAGVRIPHRGYLAGVRELCRRRGVLLCLDEVQTGLGRTGRWFAWEHEEARPDLIVLGKALSGGMYPVSCLAGAAEVMGLFTPGSHGSTFGGNPLAAATCLAALDVLEEERLPERAAELGDHALGRLRAALGGRPGILDVRGRGLMLAVEYAEPVAARVARALAAAGVLAKDTRGSVVRLLPPLVIPRDVLDAALDVAIPVLAAGERNPG
jgi:ornithine--oxo-acid transaminase